MSLTIQDLKAKNLILLETISGSRAYGLDLPHSDTDIRGVFFLPKDKFYGLNYIAQVSNETNDEVYFELGRFIELLLQSNPNVLELLSAPEHCILYKNPMMDLIKEEYFISKQCKQSFAGYALGQMKKARGLNKKIMNPIPKEKKSLLDFCFIIEDTKAIRLANWLLSQNIKQEQIGLVQLEHATHLYAVFCDKENKLGYQGILRNNLDSVILKSRVSNKLTPIAYMSFNQEGFTSYCRDYESYWRWVEERNEERYQNNQSHGKQYDSKNMMHTFRLLEMAKDIALYKKIIVKRPNREDLLDIRRGKFEYDELIYKAEMLMTEVESLFEQSNLPDNVDKEKALNALIEIRKSIY